MAPHADLQLYLVARLSLTALLMGAAGMLVGAKWPTGRGVWPQLLAGQLVGFALALLGVLLARAAPEQL
ncbi:MAG TPA: hypothetical protein VN750_13895 [Steroidobacteraceae bacterium]|nr:hypothetical protein [Steroidobacteraceae bacterium]